MADDLALGPNGLPLGNLGDPKFAGERVFVVTLKNWDDNESLYADMENSGGPLHVPQRVVVCTDRRPEERNTNYMLTYDEAVALSHDPRVAAVELNPADRGLAITLHSWVTTSTFSKAFALTGTDRDWGLFRTRAKNNPSGWGAGGSYTLNSSTTVLSDTSGKNVDVVIVDGGLPYPVTLEYAQNPDGTGYPRMVEYNWNGSYSYAGHSNGHQAHTSGTVAGNSQGHARDANIYNLTYNDSITLVKNFHINKTINPLTGVKNPTITNNSWGYGGGVTSYSTLKLNTSKIHYRGTDYFPISGSAGTYTWDDAVVQSCGFPSQFGNGFPARDAATDANFIDAAYSGVIHVVSAGNSYFYVAKPSSNPADDYNNYIIYNGSTIYYHRGSSPGAADEVVSSNYSLDYCPILVGAIGAVVTGTMSSNTVNYVYGLSGSYTGLLPADYKSEFSNYGTRVDVYAPGEATLSVINGTSYTSGTITDPRATALGITDGYSTFGRDAGTSMSGPHVCGVLACILEKYPRMTAPDIRKWVSAMSPSTMISTLGGPTDATDSGFLTWSTSSNRQIIYHPSSRVQEAEVGGFFPAAYPDVKARYRSTNGQIWPRTASLVAYNNQATLALSASTTATTNGATVTLNLITTNLPDGTQVPYIISARMRTGAVLVDSGFSGVYTTNTAMTGTITSFNTAPNTGNRITTSGGGVGTRTAITKSLLGAGALTVSNSPSFGNNDDGYWFLSLPFNITFNGTVYSTIYVSTNFYITFGGGSTAFSSLGAANPAFNKIMISSADNSAQRIYYGTEGSAPNRTYRVRLEGHNAANGGTLGNPDMLYEAVFYENAPNQIDIQIGVNSKYSFLGSAYNFNTSVINNAPLTGNFTVSGGSATLSVVLTATSPYQIYVRTNTFPAAVATFTVN